MNDPRTTVILSLYKRPYCLEEQIEAIRNQTVPTDIWIDYTVIEGSKTAETLDLSFLGNFLEDDIKLNIHINQNLSHIGRYYYALNARAPYVFILDDDLVPGKNYLKHCMDTMKSIGDCVLCAYGVRFNAGTTSYDVYKRYGWKKSWNMSCSVSSGDLFSPTQADMGGHSWFLKRENLKYIAYGQPLTHKNTDDLHFSFMCQKYGNLKIYVPSQIQSEPENLGSDNDKGCKHNKDENASYRSGDFTELRNRTVKHQVLNGWKFIE